MRFSGTLRRPALLASLVMAFALLGTAPAAASPAAVKHTCFGYTGTFAGTVVRADWSYAGPECFGVAPSGTIWHTWPGAGKWHEMPGNGRALGIFRLYDWAETRDRTVEVYTYENRWCQDYDYGKGWAGYWFDCT